MTTPYTITKSDGSTLATIYPLETSGPAGESSPLQVGCGLTVPIVSMAPGQLILAGNLVGLFGVGFNFVIAGASANNGANTVGTVTYNGGLNQTFINPGTAIVSGSGGNVLLQAFLVAGDQTQPPNRFIAGFPFTIQHQPVPPNTGANVGPYSVLAGHNAQFDVVSGYTSIPVTSIPVVDPSFPVVTQYQLVYSIGAPSVLLMTGVNSLNWGSKIWENMVRMTEHFAYTSSPDTNPNIGTNTPLEGQLWFNTTTKVMSVYDGVSWTALGGGGGAVSSFNTRTGAVTLTSADVTTALGYIPPTGSIFTSGTNGLTPASGGGTVHFLRADGTWATPAGGGGGTVNSVAVTGDAAISVGGSPITSSGTITLTSNIFTSGAKGVVPASGGGTVNFLRADGTWQAPPGGGGGTVNSVGVASTDLTVSGSPVTSSGTITLNLQTQAAVSGVWGSGTAIPQITVNTKGIITHVVNVTPTTFTAVAQGEVSASGGGTANFLRADGTWAAPTISGPGSTQVAVCTADQSAAGAGTNGTASTFLSVALAASAYYAFEIMVFFSPYSNPMYARPTFSGTVNAVHFYGMISDGSGSIIAPANGGCVSIGTSATAASNGVNAIFLDNNPSGIVIKGYISTNTAGTLGFNFSYSSNTATLKRGGYMTVTRVG